MRARGFTILEALTAMVVTLVAAVGVVAASNQGVRFNAEGRHLTRAAAIAQDFAANLDVWPYPGAATPEPRLTPGAHNGTAELAAGYLGISNAALDEAGGAYTRTWTVTALPDANSNGVPDGVSVVLSVGWGRGALARSFDFYMTKANPGDKQ